MTKDGAVTWPAPPIQVAAAPPKKVDDTAPIEPAKQEISPLVKYGLSAAGALLVGWIAVNAPLLFRRQCAGEVDRRRWNDDRRSARGAFGQCHRAADNP